MPLFSRVMSRVSPKLLRAIRVRLLMPMSNIEATLPATGRVLDVGCGYGHVLSQLAARRPDLEFLGIDLDPDAIARANALWQLPNLRFAAVPIEKVRELTPDGFDHILLLDVIHHVTREQEGAIVDECARLLNPGGRLLVKEMEYGRCAFGVFLDTHVSRCPPTVRTNEELQTSLSRNLRVMSTERGRKFAIGYVHVLAEKA